jgi:hypothetical protein
MASAGVHVFLLGVIAGVAALSPPGFKDVTNAPAGSQSSSSRCGDESVLDEDESTSDADLVMTITDCEDETDQRLSKR